MLQFEIEVQEVVGECSAVAKGVLGLAPFAGTIHRETPRRGSSASVATARWSPGKRSSG